MKKIALVVDVDNWAFANIANNLKKELSNKYEFKIIAMDNLNNRIEKLWYVVQDCDVIHFLWRGHLLFNLWEDFENYTYSIGINPEKFKRKFVYNKTITTAVYDHLYLDKQFDITQTLFSMYPYYYVSSNKLFEIYNNLDLKYKPNCVITDGVDLNLFYPIDLERFNNLDDRKIIIGWVGNSAWQNKDDDIKGVNTILIPAINELKKEGYNIDLYLADKQTNPIARDKMTKYYSKIDLYVCTSSMEGTPNPVLESMACGIPVITTDVGIVKDVLGKLQKEAILEERSINCLKEKIIFMLKNKEKFKEFSQENLKEIKKWTWKTVADKFGDFIEEVLLIYK